MAFPTAPLIVFIKLFICRAFSGEPGAQRDTEELQRICPLRTCGLNREEGRNPKINNDVFVIIPALEK